jgi:hypothetical protein
VDHLSKTVDSCLLYKTDEYLGTVIGPGFPVWCYAEFTYHFPGFANEPRNWPTRR